MIFCVVRLYLFCGDQLCVIYVEEASSGETSIGCEHSRVFAFLPIFPLDMCYIISLESEKLLYQISGIT